eukprot:Tbor_TRINITY_DN4412_c0_g2::TRINITY_DN4412_c0_g2_i1::g.7917::m.7917
MPPRMPIAVGVDSALKPSTRENIGNQMMSIKGDKTVVTKEKLFSTPHGMIQNTAISDSDDDNSELSDNISNPPNWENNAARKTLDMQWYFSSGPLRISAHTGKPHWRRLHAANTTVIPQPNGGLHVIKTTIPHKSDEDLTREVEHSSVAKPKAKISNFPLFASSQRLTTPLLREEIARMSVKQLPQKPNQKVLCSTDGSSIFSVTNVSQGGQKASCVSDCAEGYVSQLGVENESTTGSQTSNISSKRVATSIKKETELEKTNNKTLSFELAEASERLRLLESLLSRQGRRGF